ncbi:hypothetical protein SCACP_21340 [Sporomusa carbonis]|uniref:hypothetical protein n=1 Tax=Sporomusa carbonis TaxID=3076075 RepID=UPI003A5DD3D3
MDRLFDIIEIVFRLFLFAVVFGFSYVAGMVPGSFVSVAFAKLGLNSEIGFWIGCIPGMLYFLIRFKNIYWWKNYSQSETKQ